jgi:UDP-N-acetylenolpyruvoylglucosamine reductase
MACGLVIINHIPATKFARHATVYHRCIGAGENWDNIVARTVNAICGIELLSGIGTTGATPVQNVGAYGAEIADTFVDKHTTLPPTNLSLSKQTAIYLPCTFLKMTNATILTSIVRLTKNRPKPPFYASLQAYLKTALPTTPARHPRPCSQIALAACPTCKIANTGSF